MSQEEIREKIVKNATELYMRDGCKRVTMDQIATHMHISKRTLYELFATKDELLSACLKEVHKEIHNKILTLSSQVDEPMMLALFMMRHAVIVNHKYGTLLCDIERYYPEIHEEYRRVHSDCFRAGVLNTLRIAQTENILRPNVNLEEISEMMMQFMQNNQKLNPEEKVEYMRKVNEAGFTFIRGLMTTEAIQKYDEHETLFRQLVDSETNQ